MSWHETVDLDELVQKQRVVVHLEQKKILLLWHEGQVHAVLDKCPHLGFSLTKAKINADNEIVCPFHRSAFDLCNGEVKCWAVWPKIFSGILAKVSAPRPLEVFAVRVDDNKVMVKV